MTRNNNYLLYHVLHIAIHFKIEVDACTPPNRSQIKGLLSKTFKSLLRPSNPKYACPIHLTCSHRRLWMNFVKQQDSFSNNIVYCPMNQTWPNQPLFACTFIFFSKSIHVCCLRNSSSQTSFIRFTKYFKYVKVVAFSILLSSSQALATWSYASMHKAILHVQMEFNPTTQHAYFFYTK